MTGVCDLPVGKLPKLNIGTTFIEFPSEVVDESSCLLGGSLSDDFRALNVLFEVRADEGCDRGFPIFSKKPASSFDFRSAVPSCSLRSIFVARE